MPEFACCAVSDDGELAVLFDLHGETTVYLPDRTTDVMGASRLDQWE